MADPLFLRAIRGEAVERTPTWIMRQAGRYLPEYRAIREKTDFLGLCKTPELAAEVTLQPIRRIGVDAAILFADILLPLEAMGARLVFAPGDGPTFPEPIRTRQDAESLIHPDVEATLGYVYEALRTVKKDLPPEIAMLGFGGTPWTLAAYLVQGGGSKNFAYPLAWSHRDPEGLGFLLDKIAETSADYLEGQVDAGAQAIQLFDTWGGLLDAERWERVAMPPLLKVIERLQGRVPLIYYGRGTFHLLPLLRRLPVEVLSVDWRVPLDRVRAEVGPDKVLQGNLDPTVLLSDEATIEAKVLTMLEQAGGGGHIANLGHGILPMTPPEHAARFVDAVRSASSTAGG